MSSSFYTLVQIQNLMPTNLVRGEASIQNGTLVGALPGTIAAGATSPMIRINASNSLSGSSGSITYRHSIGGVEKKTSFVFKCDQARTNIAHVVSEIDDAIEVSTTPFTNGDHPLTASFVVRSA